MDPISKSNIYKVSNNQNAIIDAFEAAASSFAVNKKIPGAKFYQPQKEAEKPKFNDTKNDQDLLMQFDDDSPEQEDSPENDLEIINLCPQKNKGEKQQQNAETAFTENVKLPTPSNSVIYPPPMLDETDPDKIRLLHSWYWAGYYTGLADGKKIASNQ